MHKASLAILVTGGMDSTVLLYENRLRRPKPITIDYGHDAFPIQVDMINHHIKKLSLPELEIIKIGFHDWQKKPGLFTPNYIPDEEEPLAEWDKLRYAKFFIEGRNMIMVAYALAYCSAHKIDELMAGYLYHETEWEKRRTIKLLTGDNSPHFVDTMNLLTNVGLSYQVRLRAPFYEQRLSKDDVFCLGRNHNIDYTRTYTCYFDPPCHKCDNCLLRDEIMAKYGVDA